MGGCFLALALGVLGYILTQSWLGALLGMFLAGFIHPSKKEYTTHTYTGERRYTAPHKMSAEMLQSIVQLSALVMRADNRMMRSELYLFRDFILQNFGSEVASDAIDYLQTIREADINAEDACNVLNSTINYTEKMQILRFLFQLAYVDGAINHDEMSYITYIATLLQIRQHDFIYMRATFEYTQKNQHQYSNTHNSGYSAGESKLDKAYAILGVKSTDSDEVIKKAYRSLAVANHPDKVQHLGETARKEAEKRFSEISEAYNEIKKTRNL